MPYFPPAGGGSDLILGPSANNASPGTVLTANNVAYVKKTGGSDSNTGTNWAEAFQHVSHAYEIIIGQGGGTIYAEDGALCNPVTGYGVPLRGNFDTGVGGTGWVNLGNTAGVTLIIVPVAGGQFSAAQGSLAVKGGTWLTPMLWLTGINYGQLTFQNWNMNMPSGSIPSLRAGISSPLPVWASGTTYSADQQVSYNGQSYLSLIDGNVGHQPDTSTAQWVSDGRPDGLGTAFCEGVQFYNCSVQNIGHDVGPAGDFGFTFWFWWYQSVLAHYNPNSPGASAELNSCLRYIASPSVALGYCANYLHQFRDCRMAGGGIYSIGATQINVEHILGENMNFPGWSANASPNGYGQGSGTLVDWQQTDSFEFRTLINNGTDAIRVTDCGPCDGPVIVEASVGTSALAYFPAGSGIMGPTAFLEHDGGRELFGPVASVYPNVAADPSEASAGAATGPDNRTGSGWDMSGDYIINAGVPSAGDAVAVGMWVKGAANSLDFRLSNGSTGTLTVTTSSRGQVTLAPSLSNGFYVSLYDGRPWESGVWTWLSGWVRFDSFTGSPGYTVQLVLGGGKTVAFPWVIYVPASGGVSLSQIKRWVRYACPAPTQWVSHVPTSPSPGALAFQPGQRLGFWDATLGVWKYLDIDDGTVRIT
jgi:hypothetical protein